MSDEDLRRGYRAMVSGGMSIMGDEQIDALIKTGQEVRKERDPNFLSADAQYLQEYVEISEGFILSRTSLRSAVDSLAELNKKFEGRVSKAAVKTSIPNPGVYMAEREDYDEEDWDRMEDYERDGWMPSDVSC
ncbi:MAG: hypothetical protein ACW99J_17910 [Candidatus Thorarchaeota archaeon]|jgi:hypothetical protein